MNVKNIQFLVYVISGLTAGLAAVVVTARSMLVTMRTLGGLELDSIAAVCVGGVSLMGGRGTIVGAMIGVLIMGVITNALTIIGAGAVLQGIVRGATIIAAVTIDYLRRR
jgi:ribose/xylose/arabinose/galactoside ABC-type transport system permease subunit